MSSECSQKKMEMTDHAVPLPAIRQHTNELNKLFPDET